MADMMNVRLSLQLTRPLGGVEALGEGVTAFQIPIITGQLHPLDAAGLETAGRTLYGAQGVIFLEIGRAHV